MDDTLKWVIGISVTTVLTIGGIAWRIIYQGRREREKQIEQKLNIHFEDIKREVIDHISEMARSITVRNNRLVTSYTPIGESYPFEKEESYKCFKLHFPEEAIEWEQLNNAALKLIDTLEQISKQKQLFEVGHDIKRYTKSSINEFEKTLRDWENQYENSKFEFDHSLDHLQIGYIEFNTKLVKKLDAISKYGIGSEFKKVNNCPICKKF